MTNLTFAELTALIGVNGLVVNDRYFITDKNWTIIAITTNAYRVVVPIVTEVTKAELDALVTANELNEGLQYKVTDKDWLLLATSGNTLSAMNGEITVMHGDTLPDYIYFKKMFVDSGLITGDMNGDTGESIGFIVFGNRNFIPRLIHINTDVVTDLLITSNGTTISSMANANGYYAIPVIGEAVTGRVYFEGLNIEATGNQLNENGFRAICEFELYRFSI